MGVPKGVLMKRFAILLVLVLTLVAAACDGTVTPTTSDGTDTTQAPETTEAPDTTQAPETTEAPETTQAPDTTAAPGDTTAPEEDGETPWWILILVGIGLLLLIGALVSRGSKSTTPAAPPPVTWKDHARRGYADARWLYDNMTEDLAVWRGNATFEGATDAGETAGTSRAQAWTDVTAKYAKASDELYALEASAPDNNTALVAQNAVAALKATRQAVDARADARLSYRKADAEGAPSTDLADARDREVRASRNLADARSAYAKALTDLSTIT